MFKPRRNEEHEGGAKLAPASRVFSALRGIGRAPQWGIALVFLAMLTVSWRRWTSPISDTGREMDLPWRLLNGEWLYRDVHYIYPPLSPWLNAGLYRVFGAHWDALLGSGVVGGTLIAALCYRIARRLLSPAESSLAAAGVIVWCVFKPAGNLISPYSFAALHGMILGLGAMLLTLRYAESAGRSAAGNLLGAGVLLGLAAITKQEFALAGAATVAAGVFYLRRGQRREACRDLALAGIPAALITSIVYGGMLRAIGARTLIEDCHLFYTHLPASLVYYNAHRTGFDRPLFSLLQILGAAALMVAVARTIAILAQEERRRQPRAWLLTAVCLAVVLGVRLLSGSQWDGSPLRALPLLLLLILFLEWRRRVNGAFSPQLFILAFYSLAVLARVALRVPSGGAFGGFFLPTSLIVLLYLLLHSLPVGVAGFSRNPDAGRRAYRIGLALFLTMLCATAIVFGVRYRKNFSFEIATPRARLFLPKSSGPAIAQALQFLEAETRPGESIAVLPEGSDLAFLAGRRMPLRHQILIPGLMLPEDEQAAIARLRDERVRYILILNRPMREFGAERFGRDFYPDLGRWVEQNYRQVRLFGMEGEAAPEIGHPKFFIRVLAAR
ncbi:MAG: glycosyltransferase family 39 protein [Blastocatellia bacterium]|nr:glycosyltransferase family 39 protein [Blastocatellia bacterium]